MDDPAKPDPQASIDPATEHTFHLEPPPGGSVMRIFTFLPGTVDSEKVAAAVEAVASRFDRGQTMEKDDPAMHTTRTTDYIVVLSGEIDLELDEGEVHLRPGDVVVQCRTRHAWRNRGLSRAPSPAFLISSPNYR